MASSRASRGYWPRLQVAEKYSPKGIHAPGAKKQSDPGKCSGSCQLCDHVLPHQFSRFVSSRFFPFHFDALDPLAFFFASNFASNLDLSIFLSASDLAAPVLPFFFTCSLTSISASSHLSTGPTMASSRAITGYFLLFCLLARSARMTHQHSVFCLISFAWSSLIEPPSSKMTGQGFVAFFEPTMLLQYQLATWFWSFEPKLFLCIGFRLTS